MHFQVFFLQKYIKEYMCGGSLNEQPSTIILNLI